MKISHLLTISKIWQFLLLFTLLVNVSCGAKKKLVDKVTVKKELKQEVTMSKKDSIAMYNWFKEYLSKLEVEPVVVTDSVYVEIETPKGNFKVTSKNAKIKASTTEIETKEEKVQETKIDSTGTTETKEKVKVVKKDVETKEPLLFNLIIAGSLVLLILFLLFKADFIKR